MVKDQTPIDALFERSSDSARPSQRRKHRTLRNWLIALGSLVALLGIGAGVAFAMISSTYNEIARITAFDPSLERPAAIEAKPGTKAPINILLLGSDSRETIDPTATADDLKGFRSDAIIVAQVSPDRRHLTLMSIMRDNWVEIQGVGEAKINAAVAYGGIPLAVNTIEQFIDARIDHVALIDFESFRGLTDAVGGVTVNNAIPFTSDSGIDFAEGEIDLNGKTALDFVRERYAFSDGDYQRARNQQAYLKGLTQKILSAQTLGSIDKMTGTFQALKPYLILDEGFDLSAAVGLGYDMRDLRSDDMAFFTSPTLGTGTSADGQSIVLPDWTEMAQVRSAFRDGTLHEYAATRTLGAELPDG